MNFVDTRPKPALWIFVVLCAITAFIFITSFSAPNPGRPPTVEQPATNANSQGS